MPLQESERFIEQIGKILRNILALKSLNDFAAKIIVYEMITL